MSGTAPEPSPFSGGTLEECQNFIISIRKHSLALGQFHNNAWIADYVSCCLVGEAFMWHMQLPPDVGKDWVELQKALIEHYSRPDSRRFPAVALPSEDAPTIIKTSLSIRDDARVGCVSVQSEGLSRPAYIGYDSSSHPGHAGGPHLTFRREDALKIRYVPSNRRFQVVGSPWASFKHTLLGVVRNLEEESDEVWADDSFYLTGTETPCGPGHLKSSITSPAHGPTRCRVWSVGSKDTVTASWGGVDLLPMIMNPNPDGHPHTGEIILVVDKTRFLERFSYVGNKYHQANFVFTPLTNAHGVV
ncbi:hypothetical protein FRB93_009307 [Tulasnella sp. JGI-2019a]|nr:hypothetical protein FRB93_009307 [Tulasnella sp. JGI-2019a]